jgi:hypothetical protein
MKAIFKNRNICDIEVDDVNTWDAPDFCDAFISSARWEDTGEFLNDEELEQLNEDRDLVYDAALSAVY